jgi:hypothetical protein
MIKHAETPQGLPPMEIEGNDDEESQAMSTLGDDDEDYDERQSLVVQRVELGQIAVLVLKQGCKDPFS